MKKIFYADLRTLALLRFSLGLLLFFDFLRRVQFAEVFYSDAGILRRSVLLAKFHNIWKPSLLFLNGTPTYAIILLVIGMVASLFYAFGVRTRVMNIIIWVILISFHERFSLSLNAGDILLTLLVFWSFFLPMNAIASWDSAWVKRDKNFPVDYKVSSVFTFSWIAQILFMYLFTFSYKWHPDWFREGTSLYYALNLDTFTTGFGRWLLNFPGLLKLLSISTLWLEGLGPLTLLIPWRVGLFRILAMGAFWGLHLGIASTMTIGTFAPCCLLLWLFVLPSEFWDWGQRLLKRVIPSDSYQIYYDKDCGFCKRMVFVIDAWFCLQNIQIKSSEEDASLHKKMIKKNSWAGRNSKGEIFYRWDNFINILRYSPLVAVVFFIKLIPKSMGNFLYNTVASNRPFFTRSMNRLGYSSINIFPGKFLQFIGVLLITLALAFNLDGISKGKIIDIKGNVKHLALLIRLNQKWDMFAPYPARSEGWLVIEGHLVNGKTWDPWRNKEVDFTKPLDMAKEYKNNVWRKVIGRLRQDNYKDYRLYFGKYICRQWNNKRPRGGERLQSFQIYFLSDLTPRPGEESKPIQKNKLWDHSCFKKTSWPE